MTMYNNTRPYAFLSSDEQKEVRDALKEGKATYWYPSWFASGSPDEFIKQVSLDPFPNSVYRIPRKPRELYVVYDNGRRMEVSSDPIAFAHKTNLTVAKFVEVVE